MTRHVIRPSARPRARLCPSSIIPPGFIFEHPNDVRDMGHAVHESIAEYVEGREPDDRAISAKYDVEQTELKMLAALGQDAYDSIRPVLPDEIHAEVRLSGPMGDGTADVFGQYPNNGQVVIVDWKSGHVESDAYEQLLAYAHAAVHMFNPQVPEGQPLAKIVPVDLRYRQMLPYDVWPEDLAGLEFRDAEIQKQAGKVYGPGDACVFCPRRYECEARVQYIRASAKQLMDVGDSPTTISDKEVGSLYIAAKAVESAAKDARAIIKSLVDERGPIATCNGKELAFKEGEKKTISAKEAWPVLQRHGFSDEDISNVLSVSKGAVEAITGDKYDQELAAGNVGPRQKGKVKSAMIVALQDGGAITSTPTRTMRERKISE